MKQKADVRAARPAAAAFVHVELDAELARLRREPGWRSGTRNAITLVKEPNLSVVLALLKPGTRLDAHHAPAPLTLHVLSGRVRFRAEEREAALGPGALVALERAVEHDVEALKESALLLTLSPAA